MCGTITDAIAIEGVDVARHRLRDPATHVVEVGVNAIWAKFTQLCVEIVVLVVDGGIVAGLFHYPAALLRASGDSDHLLGAESLGDPTRQREDDTEMNRVNPLRHRNREDDWQ